jgi:hypothetical protein
MALCPQCRRDPDPLLAPFCAACSKAYGITPAVAGMVRIAIEDGRAECRRIVQRLIAGRCLDSQKQCHYCACTIRERRDHAADCAWVAGIDLYLDS